MASYTFIGEVIGGESFSGLDVKLHDSINGHYGGFDFVLNIILNVNGRFLTVSVDESSESFDDAKVASLVGVIQSRASFTVNLIGLQSGYPLEGKITHILDPLGDLKRIYLVDSSKFDDVPISESNIETFNSTKIWKETNYGQVLENLRLAMTYDGSAMYAYRALESIRQNFKTPEMQDRIATWDSMRRSLRFERSYIKSIESLGTQARHGEILDLKFSERMNLINKTRNIVARFLIYVENGKLPLQEGNFPTLT